MAYCPQCGADASNSEICPHCGARIDSARAENPYEAGSQTTGATPYDDVDAPEIPGFGGAIVVCLRKLFTWKGRASRSEFWYFFLVCYLLRLAAAPLAKILLRLFPISSISAAMFSLNVVSQLFGVIWTLVLVSVTIRRFHDSGRSAWNYLWILVPECVSSVVSFYFSYNFSKFLLHAQASTRLNYGMTAYSGLIVVSFLYVLILCAWPPTHGPNKYGPEPRKRA